MSPLDMSTGRHLDNAPTPAAGWKCPACDADQAGRLELGCTACGAGAPGKFVGVDPPAQASYEPTPPTPDLSVRIDIAFASWLKATGAPQDRESKQLAYAAFRAGYMTATSQIVTAQTLPGTAETRTIIAALRLFIEHALPTLGEEIASGEYLSGEAIAAVIRKLERTQ